MAGEMVSFRSNGQQAEGRSPRCRPPAKARGRRHPRNGGGWSRIKDVADQFAAAGFVALAPDLFHGQDDGGAGRGRQADDGLKMGRGGEDIGRGHAPENDADDRKVGASGTASAAAYRYIWRRWSRSMRASCTTACYPGDQPDLTKLAGPVLGHYGENDGWATPQVARRYEKQIRDAGKQVEFYIYTGATARVLQPDTKSRRPAASTTKRPPPGLGSHGSLLQQHLE